MLAPQLRQQIFSLWTAFWSSGMSNPITSIEQITYLLFLKQIEQLDADHVKNGKRSLYETDEEQLLRWSALQTAENPYERLTQKIFPWLRTLGDTIDARWRDDKDKKLKVTEYLEDAFFQLPKEKTGTLDLALKSVNSLFDNAGSQNDDLMGDIFEYLLDQLSTSGKNGQFRTPRHLIRFMIELLEPEEGKRILDPAGGTAGFLTNTVLYHRQRRTLRQNPDQLKLEWDGTPHRLNRDYTPTRDEFTGFDNDRTMVRIGWMNMILHGISNPRYEQKDPLGRGFTEAGEYDYVFANPPYSGNVDISDLNPKFPRKDEKPIRTNETEEEKIKREAALERKDPITDSSELLFVWLLLRLLKPGGKIAVIVPEGLLFGSTSAHKLLRRTLIYDNIVEGVISLPQGVFNPYTGVKTSILIVTKGDGTPNEVIAGVEKPKTEKVWFYEIVSDGFTLGSNRNPQPLKDNDLWDALEKWHKRHDVKSVEEDAREKAYYQPDKFLQRWRKVDENLTKSLVETKEKLGQILAVQEIFRQLEQNYPQPLNISKAEENTVNESLSLLSQLFKRFYVQTQNTKEFKAVDLTKVNIDDLRKKFRTWILQADKNPSILEQSDQKSSYFETHGRALLEQALENFAPQIQGILESLTKEEIDKSLTQEAKAVKPEDERIRDNMPPAPSELLIKFAKLDGYNIYLRSSEVHRHTEKLTEPKSWTVDVRLWRKQPDWKAPPKPEPKVKKGTEPKAPLPKTPQIVGSHDKKEKLRPEYIEAALGKDQYLNSDFLEPECIEANDFNLSANRYKPLQLTSDAVDAGTTAKQLRELLEMEDELRLELQKLLNMVEGKV
jgi:type I restriction enzyme M protein